MGGRGFKRKRHPADGRIPKALALGDCKGHAGVLVMCDEKKEQRAMHEVADLINDFAADHREFALKTTAGEAAGAAEGDTVTPANASVGSAYHSVADELALELAAIQGRTSASTDVPAPVRLHDKFSSKRARFMELGFRGLGLVWMSDDEPQDGHACALAAVHAAMEKSLADKLPPTRSVSRMIPLARIVSANADEIGLTLRQLVQAAGDGNGGGKTYRLDVRSRNNTTFDKSAAMACVYSIMVGCGYKRQEDGGAWVVIVEVFKTYAGVAVLKGQEWDRYHRYNVRLCGEREEDRLARLARGGAGGAGIDSSGPGTGARARDGGDADSPYDEEAEGDADGQDDAAGSDQAAALAMPTIAGAQAWVPSNLAKRAKTGDAVVAPMWHVSVQLGQGGGGRCVLQPSSMQSMPASSHCSAAGMAADSAEAGEPYAYLAFTVQDAGGTGRRCMVVNHTYSPPAYRGQGLAALLCDAAFSWAREQGYCILAECSYVRDKYVPELLAGKRAQAAGRCTWGPTTGVKGEVQPGIWKSGQQGTVVPA